MEDYAQQQYSNQYIPPHWGKANGGMVDEKRWPPFVNTPWNMEQVEYALPIKGRKKKGGTILEEVEDESWSAWFQQLWSALTSDEHLPKRFRRFVKKHGREKITDIKMVRAPVGTPGVVAVQLITAGKWDELKKKAGFDEVFHTGLLINNKYVIEKLEKLEAREEPGYASQGGKAETYDLDMGDKEGQITIAELLENGRKKMGKSFYTYDFLNSNCQTFVMELAQASGFLDAEGRQWIKQDLKTLIEEMPNLSKWLGVKLTDVARDTTNIIEEAVAKRGGQVLGGQRRVRGRGGFWTEAGF
jgi:hypothetical protein